MAAVKTATKLVKMVTDEKKPDPKKPGKAGKFLTGLKDWAISPGGIFTILAIIGLVWYVNHKTKDE
jgi:hypothetical protein